MRTQKHWGQHDRSRSARGGFTFVELVLATVILAIFAGITVPRYANFATRQRAEAVAQRIRLDLTLARRQARFSSSNQQIIFDVDADKYVLSNMQDMDDPAEEYVVSLRDEPYKARIVSAEFGGDTQVIFDGYGMPDTGGTVIVQVGVYQKTVTVDGQTGRASVP